MKTLPEIRWAFAEYAVEFRGGSVLMWQPLFAVFISIMIFEEMNMEYDRNGE